MRRFCIAILVPALSLALIACGDEVKVDFPVDDSKKLSEVTASEARGICESTMTVMDDVKGWVCTASAVGKTYTTGDTSKCEAEKTSCLQEEMSFSSDCKEAVPPTYQKCDITVGELESCMNDALSLMEDMMKDIQCGTKEMPKNLGYQPPASCMQLEEKCPDAFSDFDVSSTDVQDRASPQPG